jgi:hypothetical protein
MHKGRRPRAGSQFTLLRSSAAFPHCGPCAARLADHVADPEARRPQPPCRGPGQRPWECAPGLCTQSFEIKKKKPIARVGVVKSLEFSIADRAGTFRKSPQNSETFFEQPCVRLRPRPFHSISCLELARVLPRAKSIAGGNRAKGRKPDKQTKKLGEHVNTQVNPSGC